MINKIVTYLDLMERFGYSCDGASKTLSWLKKQKLVINERKGEWVLTDLGYDRLGYYSRKSRGTSYGDDLT